MIESERQQIIELIKKEVIPAIGCTEPIAVALCVAKAAETLGVKPEKIEVLLSANILKNAMGVGIPGTGMVGLPIAVALGALIGRSAYQLEVLRDCTPEAVEQGKQFIAEKRIRISLKEDITEKLYIEVICKSASIKRQPNKLLKATTDTPSERCCVELMNIKSWVTVLSPIFFLILRLLVMHVWQVQ